MHRALALAWLVGLMAGMPLSAQETASPEAAPIGCPDAQPGPVLEIPSTAATQPSTPDEVGQAQPLPWQTVWGLIGLRAIPDGARVAPNGVDYHPNFSMDMNFNSWIWRSQRLYLFADMRFWGEKNEFGVTNRRDGVFATSKREFDISGGLAWNYVGAWEARVFGYSYNNLNRGDSLVTPAGFNDGWAVENRYYLSSMYAKLGQPGFDVARATFLSIGYYPSKDLVGNDGRMFKPGLLLRAYLTQDLWDWPVYAFADASYISERSLQPKLLLFDVGFAARPFTSCRQLEFRLGTENTADLQLENIKSLWYVSVRYIF